MSDQTHGENVEEHRGRPESQVGRSVGCTAPEDFRQTLEMSQQP
jgi:hypothetical protein